MTDPALFEMTAPEPPPDPTRCDHCPTTATATMDGLRVKGWVAYNGRSFTGAKLTVRMCPACRRGI
jgi:hypothetical protein